MTAPTLPTINGAPLPSEEVGAYRSVMRFALLGPLEVTVDGETIALGGPKQRLVLAHLLIRANELVSAETLIDEIWGDEPPDAARGSLHSYVSHLKKALGAERLISRPPGYVLIAGADEIDAARFETLAEQARRRLASDPAAAARALREALGLWQGEPLADLAAELSLQGEIERLSALRVAAIEDRIEAELSLGRHAELVPELERLVARHPLRERLSGQLMLALYRAGRQAEALAAYHRLRAALDEDLGLQPAPAIEQLQARILNQDAALELAGQPLRGYRLVEQIGSGPLGTVHRAFEPQTEREVAIKVLSAAVANDADFVRRFDADARRVARLEHPHIVPLLDWWREPDAAYVVMPLLRGGTLTERLAGRQLSSQQALLWAEQLAAAIGAAHRQGVVHGDLRPGNVLFDAEDNAYVTDFAVGYDPARLADDGRGSADMLYLAPERRDGGPPPTAAADVYAFGVLLGELLNDGVHEAVAGSRALQAATSADPQDRPANAVDVLAAISALLAPTPAQPSADRPLPTRNPYKGLRAFEETDTADFFGRGRFVGQLVKWLADGGEASRLLAVVGPSGSGKSSVIHAGLIPALRAGALPGSEGWLFAVTHPGDRPFDKLERALLGVAVEASLPIGQLLRGRNGLGSLVERLVPAGAELVLVIDQFEELFTLTDEADQLRFLELLAATIDDRSAAVRVVITLRADFYDRPLRHEQFGRQLAESTLAMPPLTAEELEQVIVQPAAKVGLELEAGLPARIVAEMSEHPGALPLLQFSLAELWERREGRRLSLRAYDASGGIVGAVGRRAEELVRGLDAYGREVTRQLFLRLVELGEGTPDTARRVALAELQALGTDRNRLEAVIDSFARHRLLLFDRDPDSRQPTLELAHEALLRAWPRLQQWVDEGRDDLRQQRRLAVAAGQWLESTRDTSFLLTGSRLEQISAWATMSRVLLAPLEQEYLAASLAERDRLAHAEQQRREHEAALERRSAGRLRALVVTFAMGALLAGVLSIFALSESHRAATEADRAAQQARVATARELAAASAANLDVDPERSILLALEAVDVTRSVDGQVLNEAEEALHRAVRTSRLVRTVPHGGFGLAVTPDGTRFATGGVEVDDNSVTIWATDTGEQMVPIPNAGPGRHILAFSPDGDLLATAPNDGSVRLWSSHTGESIRVFRRHDNGPDVESIQMQPAFSPDGRLVAAPSYLDSAVALWDIESGALTMLTADAEGSTVVGFSPDGRWLVSGHGDGSIRIWDLSINEPHVVLTGHDWQVQQVTFSPDGSRLATASWDTTIRIWDTATWTHLVTFFADGPVNSVSYSPDGKRLASGGWGSKAIVWEADTGRRLLALAGHAAAIFSVAFVPRTEHLLTTSFDGTTRLWDVGIGAARDWLTLPGPSRDAGMAFSSDGRLIAVPGELHGVELHDTVSGQALRSLASDGEAIVDLAFGPDAASLAGAAWDGSVFAWDTATGDLGFRTTGQLNIARPFVAYSSDGRLLAVAGGDGTVKLLDATSGEPYETILTDNDVVDRVAFSPDGQLLAASVHSVGLTFTYDVQLFDTATGERVLTLEAAHNEETRGIVFSLDGSLITASSDGTVKIWDVASSEHRVLRHNVAVQDVAVSPDGTRIATAASDGRARLWELATGRQLLTLHAHAQPVAYVRFSPDGRLLATSSPDGTVALHLLPIDEFVELARTRVTRSLTDDECRQYLHLPVCPEPEAS
jgi:WD40 repeat protein/DNA-binding SARP family transcriptional activator